MDPTAFEQAIAEHQRMVFSIALHALRNRALAEEISQDVFLALLEHGDGITSPEHLLYWLRRVTSRKCIDHIRRQRWRRWLLLRDADAAVGVRWPQSLDPFLAARLQTLIRALPAEVRVALVLRFQEDLDAAAIARVLGLSEQAVRQKLRHALKVLRNRLETPRTAARTEWEQP